MRPFTEYIKFRICLAGITVEVCSLYPDVKELCREYLCDDEPDIIIWMSEKDIEKEREKYPQGERESAGYIETLAVYRKIVEKAIGYGILLIHGSAVAVDGRGYLFLAPSGMGKSTHTRLWREYFGDRAEMINDDKPLLRMEDDQILVCGTPWNGKHRLGSNKSVPLQGLCILRRGSENTIRRISAKEAYPDLLRQIYRPFADENKMKRTLELMDQLLRMPLFYMKCTISREAAQMAYAAMKEEKSETER